MAIKQALKDLIGTSFRQHMDDLCQSFTSSHDYQDISKVLLLVEGLSKRSHKLSSRGWSCLIDTPQSTLSQTVHSIIRALENLLMNAMEGTDVGDLARRGLLLYQTIPDVVL